MDLPYETQFLDNISQLFTRTKERYGMKIRVRRKDDSGTLRLNLPSTDPYDSGNAACFERKSYPAPSPREWHQRLWELHQYSHWETLSFVFIDGIPEHEDRLSPSGQAWWNLRKILASTEGCMSLHVATYPADPSKANIFIGSWREYKVYAMPANSGQNGRIPLARTASLFPSRSRMPWRRCVPL